MSRSAKTRFNASAFSRNGRLRPEYATHLGALFKGDCLDILPTFEADRFDMIFADPPFNIGKGYGRRVNDRRTDDEYLHWCQTWILECIRLLKPGGSFFLYNIPKWNIRLANFLLDSGMLFRDWIVVDVKLGLPIAGRLYPSHYSLLYFTKGKHKTFHNVRIPIKACRHCGGDVKDYGGHRNAINPKGINLTDVWGDIPPVRHWKFKSKKRKANALSTKLLERVVGMSTEVGDVVLDPFGGSGTTFAVCEKVRRRWIGIEIESAEIIVERLKENNLHHYKNDDWLEDTKSSRGTRSS
jgi:site-specific DNA-methyltransferase (adenine-specific)